MDFRVFGGGGGGLPSCFTGRGGVCCKTRVQEFTLQFNHDYSSEWVGGANEYLWGEPAMVRIMRVLLWRHRWWCPRGVGHANVIITEQWRITCNMREWVHVRRGKQRESECAWSDWFTHCMWCVVTWWRGVVHVLELLGVCGEAGNGLRGLDRLSWDVTPWNSDRVSRLSPSCRLFGLWCFSSSF